MRVAINPLQWPGGGSRSAGLDQVLAEVAAAGFGAVHTEVPDGEGVAAYRARLGRHGLAPAPGYLAGQLHRRDARPELLERARRAAAQHAELGLAEIFVAGGLVPERLGRPARSADLAPEVATLDLVAESVRLVAEVMVREGVRACVHNHVGSPIESEAELEHVLAATDPGLVRLGPDTGHLAWAGADPAAFLARHGDRVGALHLKDVRLAVVERGRREDLDYGGLVALGIWAELGLGDLPLEACLRAVAEHDLWVVVEVDRASLPTPLESARTCARWLAGAAPARSRGSSASA